MPKLLNERRYHQVVMMVDRRRKRPKDVAYALGLTVNYIYQILHRFRPNCKEIVLGVKSKAG